MKKNYILSSLLIATLLMFCSIFVNAQSSRNCELFENIEHTAWGGTGYGSYNNRTVTDNLGSWSVSAVTQMTEGSDHYLDTRSARLRGNAGDTVNIHRIEMLFDKPNGLGTVSFYYCSYGTNTGTVHNGGVIYLDYSTNGGTIWTNAGSVTAPKWVDGGEVMLEATFNVNVPGNARIKIYKKAQTGNTTVNIDNICITDFTQTNTVATPTFTPNGGNYLTPQQVTINCATDGATIRYTTNGSEPTETNGTVYTTTPINISSTTTLKAKAWKSGMEPSSVATAVYTFPTPVANIAAFKSAPTGAVYKITGDVTFVYRTGRYIFIKDETGGLMIYDNATPVITSTYNNGDIISGGVIGTHGIFNGLYQLVPSVNTAEGTPGTTVLPKVVTMAELLANFAAYESQLLLIESVTFEAGTFGTGAAGNINIHQGSDEMICRNHFGNITGYETDPSKPYHVAGFAIPYNADREICPRNTDDIFLPGSVVEAPQFSPAGGNYSEPVTVTITCATAGAKIYYTTDGTDPKETSTLFTTSFTIAETTTVKARAFHTDMTPSVIVSATYKFPNPDQVATPTFSPQGGTFTSKVSVIISCATEGAAIYYTLNGNTPTEQDILYNNPIEIAEGTTILKAKAFKNAMEPSDVASATYSVSVGIHEWETQINVFPNPTTGQLTIDNGQLIINNVEIFDVYGRKILVPTLTVLRSYDLTVFQPGVYFVKISTEKGIVIKKIIKN